MKSRLVAILLFFLSLIMDSVVYQIVRYGVPSSAGFSPRTRAFVQVFPFKRVYPDKSQWVRAWNLFGDEVVMTYLRRPVSTRVTVPL